MLSGVVTDLAELRRLSEAKEPENRRFRRYLHDHPHSEELFHIIAEDVAAHIDCTRCGNCCRETVVEVSGAEVDAIAHYLGIEPDQARRLYTVSTDDGRTALAQLHGECVFLDHNLCLIYEARPYACREFPYVAEGGPALGARVTSIFRRTSLCPIVYNTLEEYKERIRYRH
jgi:Fe-S-cluster containining protein